MEMPKNEHKAHRREVGMGALLALIIVVGSFGIITQAPAIVAKVPNVAAVISSVLVELTNVDRSSQGLATLKVSPLLTEVAEAKAQDMATKGYFAHTSPEGLSPWHWFQEKGYAFSYAGENLAIDFSESADVQRAWMNSPTHRANIVGTRFTEIGIAVQNGTYQGRPATFVVQVFGTPAPASTKRVSLGTTTPRAEAPKPAPVRDIVAEPVPAATALATTLPTTTPATPVVVLGDSAGAYLVRSVSVPWWHKIISFLK